MQPGPALCLRHFERFLPFSPPLGAVSSAGNGIFLTFERLTMKLIKFIQTFARDEDGVTAIEYGLIAALIAVVIIASVTLVGTNLANIFGDIAAALTTAGG
jgi:pilus assembly protein Flp/PilA